MRDLGVDAIAHFDEDLARVPIGRFQFFPSRIVIKNEVSEAFVYSLDLLQEVKAAVETSAAEVFNGVGVFFKDELVLAFGHFVDSFVIVVGHWFIFSFV